MGVWLVGLSTQTFMHGIKTPCSLFAISSFSAYAYFAVLSFFQVYIYHLLSYIVKLIDKFLLSRCHIISPCSLQLCTITMSHIVLFVLFFIFSDPIFVTHPVAPIIVGRNMSQCIEIMSSLEPVLLLVHR